MSFDLNNYRISIESLRILLVDLAEVHDHLRDLCSERPGAIHRSELASFGADLEDFHKKADTALSALRSQLQNDRSSIKALARCYRKDNYRYFYPKKSVPVIQDRDPSPVE